MTVYRIEEKTTGKGPWTAGDYPPPSWWLDASNMPTPDEEFRVPDWQGHLAFPSLDMLHYWFTVRDREYLRDKGFVIRTYEVPDADSVCSHNQCIYRINTAKPVEELPL